MASVVLNGVTYTDDSNASTGMGNGGHRTRFVPCLSDFLAEAATQIALAAAQAVGAAAQVPLAAAQVALAEDQVALAEDHAVSASASASAAAASALTASYIGEWSTLTGALSPPATVSHNGKLWVLVAALADVTTAEPGVSASWYRGGGALSMSAALLTSGTSWTAPTGVTSVRVRMVGGGGGGITMNSTAYYGSGEGAGGVEFVQSVSAGASYAYSIGAAGVAGNLGTAGGDTTMFGVTAQGGAAGTSASSRGSPGGVTGAPAGSLVITGSLGVDLRASIGEYHKGGDSMLGRGGMCQNTFGATLAQGPTGYGAGGQRLQGTSGTAASDGTQGCIILEYTA